MTIESQKQKPLRQGKKASPPAPGVLAVARTLNALSLIPLHACAEGRNQTIPSLLHDMTGLSKARISKGNLDTVRTSTKAKMAMHIEAMLQEQYKGDPDGLEKLRRKVDTSPVTSSGEPAQLAGWVHQLEFLPWIPLPTTKAVAQTIDELLEELLTCCRNEDLPSFKTILLAHFKSHELDVDTRAQTGKKSVLHTELEAIQLIADWERADHLTRNLVDYLYWRLITSLDAEWSSHYFAGRQTMPLFSLVMVLPQAGLLETMKVSSRRNIYFRPVRRLLQFLYALAYYFRYKKWPARAPTPKTLAEIFYRPDSQELADVSLISSYFDGSTKLTLDLALQHWEQLLQHFIAVHPGSVRPGPPIPLIMLALQWQTLLVQDKGRSFLMPDLHSYEADWRRWREQWTSLQAQQNILSEGAGQSVAEPIVWPAWSLNQPSSLS